MKKKKVKKVKEWEDKTEEEKKEELSSYISKQLKKQKFISETEARKKYVITEANNFIKDLVSVTTDEKVGKKFINFTAKIATYYEKQIYNLFKE